jgi:hypothetical protein
MQRNKSAGFSSLSLFGIFLLAFMAISTAFPAPPVPGKLKPFRVLVIIGDQWEDPAGYLVEMPKPTGQYSGYEAVPAVPGAGDFHSLMVLLKSWGIPFDIVRLDQQFLDRYMFLDMEGNPRYGTIIWDVNSSGKLLRTDYSIVTEMVSAYGLGLIALSDRISQPGIQSVLGLKYTGSWESNEKMIPVGVHFLTRGIDSPLVADSAALPHLQRQQVELLNGTVPVIEQGSYVQATAREYPSGGRAVWIGNDFNGMFCFQGLRTLLRRAITWTIGYNLYKTWENEVIMIMDDPGGASNVWLRHWHYSGLSEQTIDDYLIAPLLKHKAVLNINFVPAFVNDDKRRLEPTWTQQFTDEFGTRHDYVSGKKGYDKGVKLDVFEVMCHGLTHMQPDLVSEPGWYGAELDKERSEVGWYREFGDTRRLQEIPAAEQLWRMETAKNWLTEQFGVAPLEFCPGGLGSSRTYINNTAKLAGQAGFGWCGWETGYLGKDMIVTNWKFFGTPESPLMVAVLPDAHDFGISREPEKFAAIFDRYPNRRFMGMNEFIGYLHAVSSADWNRKVGKLTINLDYDPHYCQDFSRHATTWNLEFSDWLLQEMGTPSSIMVDGTNMGKPGMKIQIPAGTGSHHVEVMF